MGKRTRGIAGAGTALPRGGCQIASARGPCGAKVGTLCASIVAARCRTENALVKGSPDVTWSLWPLEGLRS
jgi:hypothetical protein